MVFPTKWSSYIRVTTKCTLTVQGIVPFYAYLFTIGYSFPLTPLVEEFCLHYRVCPAQLAPLVYKIIKMLTKFVELVGVEVTLRHFVYLYMPSFY